MQINNPFIKKSLALSVVATFGVITSQFISNQDSLSVDYKFSLVSQVQAAEKNNPSDSSVFESQPIPQDKVAKPVTTIKGGANQAALIANALQNKEEAEDISKDKNNSQASQTQSEQVSEVQSTSMYSELNAQSTPDKVHVTSKINNTQIDFGSRDMNFLTPQNSSLLEQESSIDLIKNNDVTAKQEIDSQEQGKSDFTNQSKSKDLYSQGTIANKESNAHNNIQSTKLFGTANVARSASAAIAQEAPIKRIDPKNKVENTQFLGAHPELEEIFNQKGRYGPLDYDREIGGTHNYYKISEDCTDPKGPCDYRHISNPVRVLKGPIEVFNSLFYKNMSIIYDKENPDYVFNSEDMEAYAPEQNKLYNWWFGKVKKTASQQHNKNLMDFHNQPDITVDWYYDNSGQVVHAYTNYYTSGKETPKTRSDVFNRLKRTINTNNVALKSKFKCKSNLRHLVPDADCMSLDDFVPNTIDRTVFIAENNLRPSLEQVILDDSLMNGNDIHLSLAKADPRYTQEIAIKEGLISYPNTPEQEEIDSKIQDGQINPFEHCPAKKQWRVGIMKYGNNYDYDSMFYQTFISLMRLGLINVHNHAANLYDLVESEESKGAKTTDQHKAPAVVNMSKESIASIYKNKSKFKEEAEEHSELMQSKGHVLGQSFGDFEMLKQSLAESQDKGDYTHSKGYQVLEIFREMHRNLYSGNKYKEYIGFYDDNFKPLKVDFAVPINYAYFSKLTNNSCFKLVPDALYDSLWDNSKYFENLKKIEKRVEQKDLDLLLVFGMRSESDLVQGALANIPIVVISHDSRFIEDSNFLAIEKELNNNGEIKYSDFYANDQELSKYENLHVRSDPFNNFNEILEFHRLIKFSKLGILADSNRDFRNKQGFNELLDAARGIGVDPVLCYGIFITPNRETSEREFSRCITELANSGVDAVYLPKYSNNNLRYFYKMLKVLIDKQIPVFSSAGIEEVKSGAFMALAHTYGKRFGNFEANVISLIMNGVKPNNISQLFYTKNLLVVNAQIAADIGWFPSYDVLSLIDITYLDVSGDN